MSTEAIVVAGLVAFSVGAYLFMFVLFLWGMRRRPAGEVPAWKVSILKPLAGLDDEFEENLASFARLEGVEYELLLGVARKKDPAWAAAKAFIKKHPELDVRLVRTNPDAALNPKVAQLMGLAAAARGEVFVISDSNVRVRPDYLQNVLRVLARPGVNLVSNAIEGAGERTFGAALDNMMLAGHVTPGVVSAYVFTGKAITIGKSLAMRRADLDRLGGFDCVAGYLAEDHALARKFAAAGMGVTVSPDVIQNRVVGTSLRRTYDRHARWAKIRRANAPLGLLGEPFLYPLGVAGLGYAVAPEPVTAALFIGAGALQGLLSPFMMRRLRGEWGPWWLVLVELARPWFFFACWVAGWTSRRLEWRGNPLEITTDTELVPARPSTWRRFADTLLFR